MALFVGSLGMLRVEEKKKTQMSEKISSLELD